MDGLPVSSPTHSPRSAQPIGSVAELLCHAHAMEEEAANRYRTLSGELDGVNDALATVFRKMAVIEAKHVARVDELAESLELPDLSGLQPTQWSPGHGPETLADDQIGPDSTEAEALKAMIVLEEAAVAFFDHVAQSTVDGDVRDLAREMAGEERDHVRLLSDWLAKVSAAHPA